MQPHRIHAWGSATPTHLTLSLQGCRSGGDVRDMSPPILLIQPCHPNKSTTCHSNSEHFTKKYHKLLTFKQKLEQNDFFAIKFKTAKKIKESKIDQNSQNFPPISKWFRQSCFVIIIQSPGQILFGLKPPSQHLSDEGQGRRNEANNHLAKGLSPGMPRGGMGVCIPPPIFQIFGNLRSKIR